MQAADLEFEPVTVMVILHTRIIIYALMILDKFSF